jgi:hypothetical protein
MTLIVTYGVTGFAVPSQGERIKGVEMGQSSNVLSSMSSYVYHHSRNILLEFFNTFYCNRNNSCVVAWQFPSNVQNSKIMSTACMVEEDAGASTKRDKKHLIVSVNKISKASQCRA